jgi:dihydropteroate synthase
MPASTGTSTGGCSAPGSCSARAADIIDVGGESAITRRPPVEADVEIARVDGLALQEALRHAR